MCSASEDWRSLAGTRSRMSDLLWFIMADTECLLAHPDNFMLTSASP